MHIPSSEGKLICTGSDDASLRIWDPRTAQSRHVVRGKLPYDWIHIYSISREHQILIFLSPGHGYHTDGLTCLSVTSDSQTIVSGSKDNSVCVVNINSGQVSVLMTQASVSLSCKLVHRLEFFLVLFENVCSLAFWYHHHRCRFAGCWLTGRPHWLYWVCRHLTKVLDP